MSFIEIKSLNKNLLYLAWITNNYPKIREDFLPDVKKYRFFLAGVYRIVARKYQFLIDPATLKLVATSAWLPFCLVHVNNLRRFSHTDKNNVPSLTII